jgi:hypothetical protein
LLSAANLQPDKINEPTRGNIEATWSRKRSSRVFGTRLCGAGQPITAVCEGHHGNSLPVWCIRQAHSNTCGGECDCELGGQPATLGHHCTELVHVRPSSGFKVLGIVGSGSILLHHGVGDKVNHVFAFLAVTERSSLKGLG